MLHCKLQLNKKRVAGRAGSGIRNSQGAKVGRGGVAFASYAGQPLGAGMSCSCSSSINVLVVALGFDLLVVLVT